MDLNRNSDEGLNALELENLEQKRDNRREEDEERLWQRRREDNAREQAQSDLLCVMCRTHSKDKTENPDSILCEGCRTRYTKLSVPVWVIGFLVAIFAVLALSLVRLPAVLTTYKSYIAAEQHQRNKEYSLSMLSYYDVLEEYSDSVPITLSAVETAMKAQNFDAAAYLVDTYLVGKSLNDAQYQQANKTVNLLETYYETIDRCGALFEDLDVTQDVDAIQLQVQQRLETLLNERGLDKTYLYYLLGNVSSDEEQSLYYLELACNENAQFTYPLAVYGNALRRFGDLPAALDIYSNALSQNAGDASAMRGVGIIALLGGESEQGLRQIQAAYDLEPYSLYMPDALIIALCENGRREEALALKLETEAEEYTYDQDMDDYLSGKMTLKQYYVG